MAFSMTTTDETLMRESNMNGDVNADAHDESPHIDAQSWIEPASPRPEGPAEDVEVPRTLLARTRVWMQDITLPQLMRICGALVVVASALTFMVQSWSGGDVLSRYFHFLGFTGVLCGAGFFCGLHNGDDKGARSFLSLVVASLPAHFVVLSAIAFSQVAESLGVERLTFAPPPFPAALATIAAGIVTAGVMTWVAMRALARNEARRLGITYLGTNLLLMVPVRDPDGVAILAGAAAAALFVYDRKFLAPIPAMRTLEGHLLRLMLAVPIVAMAARTAIYYSVSSLMFSVGAAATAALFFVASVHCRDRRWLAILLEIVSLWAGLASVLEIVEQAVRGLEVSRTHHLAFNFIAVASVLIAVSKLGALGGRVYHRGGAIVATVGTSMALWLSPNLVNSLLTLCASGLVMLEGFNRRERMSFGLGVLGLVFAILYHIRFAFLAVDLGAWGPLAVIGVVVMLAASYCEKNQRRLKAHATAMRKEWNGWDV